MLNFVLLFSLIAIGKEDENCLVTFEGCIEDEEDIIPAESIENCIERYFDDNEKEEFCRTCDKNYAVSNDEKQCISLTNLIANYKKHRLNYEREVLCYECESDYFPSKVQKSCIKVPNCVYLNFKDEGRLCLWGVQRRFCSFF